MSHHLVEAENLRYVYPDGTVALRDVSFRITHGESVAVIGANGAGKSTLLLHLNGYLAPTAGEVRIGDLSFTKKTLQEIRRRVGMVFQDRTTSSSCRRSTKTSRSSGESGIVPRGGRGAVKGALERVGAEHLRERPPYRLSGGEKKRVAIATVLSMAPDILVMDEPTNGLDPFARRRLIELMKDFRHTKIFTSHDLDMVLELCERTIVLHEGEVRADGPTLDIFRDTRFSPRAGSRSPFPCRGVPYAEGLP